MQEKESGFMLNDEICKLREKLNRSIIDGRDYAVTYKLSTQLDRLIAKYYEIDIVPNRRKNIRNQGNKKVLN